MFDVSSEFGPENGKANQTKCEFNYRVSNRSGLDRENEYRSLWRSNKVRLAVAMYTVQSKS